MSESKEFNDGMNELSEHDRHVERLLASLVPRETRVSRDRVMFLAGQASAAASDQSGMRRLTRWVWPSATVCAACLGLAAGILLSVDHRTVEQSEMSVAAAPAQPERVAAAAPRPETLKPISVPEIGKPAEQSLPSELPATELSARTDEEFDPAISPATLLTLRDQMLAGRWEDVSLANADEPAAVGGTADEPRQPPIARDLLRRWLEEQGRGRL